MTNNTNGQPAVNILERLGRDELQAFDDFMDQFGNFVAFSVRKFTSPRSADFEDAMQDALVAVWKAAPHFDRSRGAETTFMGTVIRRCMISRWQRTSAKRPHISLESFHSDPAAESDQFEMDDRLWGALDRLDPEQRTLVELAVIREQTHAQIAQATGMTHKEIRRKIRRALMILRDDLDDLRAAA